MMLENKVASKQILKAAPIKKWMRPIVYGWYREDKYLYIGMSIRGLARLFGHETIKWQDIQDADEIHIWTPTEDTTISELEQCLLTLYKPLYNKPSTYCPS